MRAVDLSDNNWPLSIRTIRDQMANEGDPLGAVILKVTEGVTYIDPVWSLWADECESLGIPWLAYHCIWDTGNGKAQAEWFLQHVRATAAGLMLDWERFGTSVAQTPVVLDFMDRVDLDPRPRFQYAANWIFSWPGVTRDPRVARWPLITPDSTPPKPWTSILMQQNPNGYYVVAGRQIDVDVVRTPGFFASLRPPAPPIGDLVADFTCTIDGNSYAVSPGGVMPITPRMLSAYASTPNIGDVSVDDEQGTRSRIMFHLAHGRWQDANGNDPGPREAKGTSVVTGPSAIDIAKAVNDDAARRLSA